MTRLLVSGLVLALLGHAGVAGAQSCAPICVTYACQPVTCYKTQLRCVPVQTTVCRPVCKPVTVMEKCTVMVPKVYDEPRTITCMKPVTRVVEQEVTKCRQVPCTATDSCGRTYQTFKTEMYTERVPVTIVEHQMETKNIVAKVVRYEPQVRDVPRVHMVREVAPVTVTRHRLQFVQVPYTTMARVPVYSSPATVYSAPATQAAAQMPLADEVASTSRR